MKRKLITLFTVIIISGISFNLYAQKQKIIFDCDLGDDIDDAYKTERS